MNRRNYFVLMILLAVLAFFPLAMPFSSSMDSSQQIVRAIPNQIGAWKGEDVPLDERTYAILETRNVLSRRYENSRGESVHLLIVSSNKDRRVAHPPEVCYLSSNFSIVDEKLEDFSLEGTTIRVKRFAAQDQKNPSHEEKVLYVYKVGKRYTPNYFTQQLLFARDLVTRRESQILLIRLSGLEGTAFKEFLPQVLAYLS